MGGGKEDLISSNNFGGFTVMITALKYEECVLAWSNWESSWLNNGVAHFSFFMSQSVHWIAGCGKGQDGGILGAL